MLLKISNKIYSDGTSRHRSGKTKSKEHKHLVGIFSFDIPFFFNSAHLKKRGKKLKQLFSTPRLLASVFTASNMYYQGACQLLCSKFQFVEFGYIVKLLKLRLFRSYEIFLFGSCPLIISVLQAFNWLMLYLQLYIHLNDTKIAISDTKYGFG